MQIAPPVLRAYNRAFPRCQKRIRRTFSARSQNRQSLLNITAQDSFHRKLVGRSTDLILDEIFQMIAVFPDRSLERHRLALNLHHLEQLENGHPHLFGQLFRPRLTVESPLHLVSHLDDLISKLYPVDWNTDRASGVNQTARNALSNPPGRVGRKPEPQAIVELFDGSHQTEVALLNQVQKAQPAVEIFSPR